MGQTEETSKSQSGLTADFQIFIVLAIVLFWEDMDT